MMWSRRRSRQLREHVRRLAETDAWLAAAQAEAREIASWPSPLACWLRLQAVLRESTVVVERAAVPASTVTSERPRMDLAARGLPRILDPNTGKPVDPLVQRVRDEALRHARGF